MSKNYFQKTAVYNAERYSAVFMKKHLLFYPYLINIFNIIALKKIKFLGEKTQVIENKII